MTSHQVRHHDVREQSITNDCDLRRRGDARLRMLLEIGEDLSFAAWLLSCVLKYFHACVLLEECRLSQVWVRTGSCRVGHYEELGAWICASEFLESFLEMVRL
jgi:hypothetical protein